MIRTIHVIVETPRTRKQHLVTITQQLYNIKHRTDVI